MFYLLRNGIYFWCLLKAFSGEVAFVGVKQMTCAFDLCLTCDLFIFEDRSNGLYHESPLCMCVCGCVGVCVCACVCACACARARARVCECVFVCVYI